ncbi:MAG TPA: T9SS type A sorting domain-containing protein [Bacteroidia bacterium]|nr:T9SS type A sorting domain-containing protein [Bacteroidia bacterium]
MKKILLVAIACITCFAARAQWTNQNVPFGYQGYLYDIKTVNANTVWANPYEATTNLLSTQDFALTIDGTNWTVGSITGSPAAYRIACMGPVDADTCYVAMYNSGGAGGNVYKTTDGGLLWQQVGANMFQQPTSFVDVVHFWNWQNGMAFGDPAGPGTLKYEIYLTADAGATWTRVPAANIPLLTNNSEYGIVNLFSTAQDRVWFGTTYGDVYRTIDYGMNWTKSATGLPPLSTANGRFDISDVAFVDSLNGLVLQTPASAAPTLMKTTDGGLTWSTVTPTGPFFSNDLCGVPGTSAFVSVGSSTGGGFGSSVTIDNGATWTLIDTSNSHTSVSFSDNVSGYTGEFIAAGDPGGAWRYSGDALSAVTRYVITRQTQVYPNPSNGMFNIIGESKTGVITFSVYDLQGKLLHSESSAELKTYNHHMNLSHLSSGVYILKILSGQNTSQHKLVIE